MFGRPQVLEEIKDNTLEKFHTRARLPVILRVVAGIVFAAVILVVVIGFYYV